MNPQKKPEGVQAVVIFPELTKTSGIHTYLYILYIEGSINIYERCFFTFPRVT